MFFSKGWVFRRGFIKGFTESYFFYSTVKLEVLGSEQRQDLWWIMQFIKLYIFENTLKWKGCWKVSISCFQCHAESILNKESTSHYDWWSFRFWLVKKSILTVWVINNLNISIQIEEIDEFHSDWWNSFRSIISSQYWLYQSIMTWIVPGIRCEAPLT